MRKKFAGVVLIVLISISMCTADNHNRFGPFDRLLAIEAFVDAIYPDLKPVKGLAFFRAEEFHAATGADNHIDIVPCHPGSGVSGGGGELTRAVPHCTGLFLSGFSDFLTISVRYSDKFPIQGFQASGSFLDQKSDGVRKDIENHPEWSPQEMTAAVIRANPRFAPDQKEEFSHSIPIQTIYEFTGCGLDPSTASFNVNRLEVKPDPVRVEIEWVLTGHRKNRGRTPNGCRATFEPFDGKLLSIPAF